MTVREFNGRLIWALQQAGANRLSRERFSELVKEWRSQVVR